jgi:hypothetical protein
MAALAEWPDRIKKIFNGITDYPADGQFEINMYSMGKAHKIIIDDKLPGDISYGTWRPKFTSKSPNGAWWATMVEKAGAKFYGDY